MALPYLCLSAHQKDFWGCGKLDCSGLHSCTLRTSNCPLCLGYPGLVMKVFRQNSDCFSWALRHYHSSPESTRFRRFEMLLPVESVRWKWQNQNSSCLIFWRHIFSSEEESSLYLYYSPYSLSPSSAIKPQVFDFPLSMGRHNKFESYPEVVQPSTCLSTCIFTWLSEQGDLMPVRKFSEYNPSASLSSSCSLVTIVLCILARYKEGQMSFSWLIRKSNYCLQSGQKGKIFMLLRGDGFLALCSVSFKTDITLLFP